MRFRLLFLALFLAHVTFGQGAGLVRIPGTDYSLVPPAGFTPSVAQSAFIDSVKAASILADDAPTPYDTMIAEFSKENFRKHDSELLSSEPVKGPFARAVLLTVRQKSPLGHPYRTLMLISGNDKMSVMVVGNYPETSVGLESTMRAAILSTVYHKPSVGKPKGR